MIDVFNLIAKTNVYLNESGLQSINTPDKAALTEQYDSYLDEHISNVKKGFDWLCTNLPQLIPDDVYETIYCNIVNHDASKYSTAEYLPYALYFYGKVPDGFCTAEINQAIDSNFNYAWLHHIHNNPHHWQYWLLQNDEDGLNILEMPYEYIIEMICDWWAFSWKSGNLTEIFNWYEKNKYIIKLNVNTRTTLEEILNKIKMVLTKGTK